MGPLSVMIKPASGLCNFRCRYCFYLDELENREKGCLGIMSEETLDAVLTEVLKNAEGHCTIAFQGGEPTLAGLQFFEKVVELEKNRNVNHCKIQNSIQTNGSLLDEKWAAFFAREGFLVGISLDGDKQLHDQNRIDANGNGTYGKVIAAIKLLQRYGVEFNILTVITAQTCRHARKVYRFFTENGLDFQQFIPCLDPLGEERGQHSWSLTPKLYGQFLKDLFDCWYADAAKGIWRYNRYFYNLLLIMKGRYPEACGMGGLCSAQIVVESDGSVYPCDFYVLDQWKLGNFCTHSLAQIEQKRRELRFIEMSAKHHPDCLSCQWQMLCRGGCRRDRCSDIADQPGKNYFCHSYRQFFEYAYPRLWELARKIP